MIMATRQTNGVALARLSLIVCISVGITDASRADLVAHWSLTEGAGTRFGNLADPAFDGFLDGGVVGWERVEEDANGNRPLQEFAARFTGTGSWIQTEYPGISGNDPRTIAFWMITDAAGGNDMLGYGLPQDSLKWHTRVNISAANGPLGAIRTEFQGGQNIGDTRIDDSMWHHVAVVFRDGGTTGEDIDHYIDGVLQTKSGNRAPTINTTPDPEYPVTIGRTRQSLTSFRYFRGLIADVRIYDEELSTEEILAIPEEEPPAPIEFDDCTQLAIECTADARLNLLTARITAAPADCVCGGLEFFAAGRSLGSFGARPDGSTEIPLDEVCATPGAELVFEVRCTESDVSASCAISCPARIGLAAHWPLNEGEGVVFEDVVGDDDGFLDPLSTVAWVPGPPTQEFAVEFSGIDSWIQTEFPGIGGTHPRTISCWIKTLDAQNHGIISWGPDSQGEKWHIRVNSNAADGPLGGLRAEVNGGFTIGTTPLNDDQWHHIAVVVPEDASLVSEIRLFVDGVLEVQEPLNVLDREFSTRLHGADVWALGIGRRVSANGIANYFRGAVADVRIYDEPLGSEELSEIIGIDPPTPCSRLSVGCTVNQELGTVTAEFATEPAGCSCRNVAIVAGGRSLGVRTASAEGTIELPLPDVCAGRRGEDVDVSFTCLDTDTTDVCIVTCPVPRRLVAHWQLNEGEGTVFEDSAGDFDGFLDPFSSVVWGIGPPSQDFAVEFSGSDSWIQTEFPGIGGTEPRTIACWIRTTTTDPHGIISWGPDSPGAKWHIRLNDTPALGVANALRTEVNGGRIIGSTVLNDGEWHHIAVVVPEGASVVDDILHYVDGQLEVVSSAAEGFPFSTALREHSVAIGRRVNAAPEYFAGAVADVRVYDVALSREEIVQISAGGPLEVCDNGEDDDGDGRIDCEDSDCGTAANCRGVPFKRTDADASGATNITDGIFLLNFLFLGGPSPPCLDAADADDSGTVNITDGVFLLNFLFLSGPNPPVPYASCGVDPSNDATGCVAFAGCP